MAKWFSHYTDLSIRGGLTLVEDQFGSQGYAFFYKTLELCYAQFDTKNEQQIKEMAQGYPSPLFKFNMQRFCSLHNRKPPTVTRLTTACALAGILECSINDWEIIIIVPKLLQSLPPNLANITRKLIANYKEITLEENRIEKKEVVIPQGSVVNEGPGSNATNQKTTTESQSFVQKLSSAERQELHFDAGQQKLKGFLLRAGFKSAMLHKNLSEIYSHFGSFEEFESWAGALVSGKKFKAADKPSQRRYFAAALLDETGLKGDSE